VAPEHGRELKPTLVSGMPKPPGTSGRKFEEEGWQRRIVISPWPAELEVHGDGSCVVRFPDVPEAMARGETKEEALFHAQDCLAAAMEACQAVEKPGSACQPAPGPQPDRGLK